MKLKHIFKDPVKQIYDITINSTHEMLTQAGLERMNAILRPCLLKILNTGSARHEFSERKNKPGLIRI